MMEQSQRVRDPFAKPPAALQRAYKRFRQQGFEEDDEAVIDFVRGLSASQQRRVHSTAYISNPKLDSVQMTFIARDLPADHDTFRHEREDVDRPAFAFDGLPGLMIVPGLVSPTVQAEVLSRLLHRDLCNPKHLTNLHLHYELPYPPPVLAGKKAEGIDTGQRDPSLSSVNGTDQPTGHSVASSFFSYSPTGPSQLFPKDPSQLKPLTISRFLTRKLRWMTLGGQYDWTRKQYPEEIAPPFPEDMKLLLEGLFPDMKAEAAIVNIYSPGDTLSLHRDVSEFCDQGLVSLSIGCDALFVIGLEDGLGCDKSDNQQRTAVVRVRSGDAVYMSGEARFAWHGVPLIIPNTCPDWLQDWPAESAGSAEKPFEDWRGWMSHKRINLNVRQMYA